MDLLKIGLIADTSKAIEGMEKTAKSVNTLGNALISGKKVAHEYGLALDQKLAEISEKVSAGLISNQKGIEQSYKLLAEQRAKMLAGMGQESKEYKTLVTYSDAYKKELDKLNASQKKQAETTKKSASSMEDMGKSSGNAATKLLSVAKNILKFQLLMGPITAVIRGFKNTIRDSVNLAAEAEQRFSKLATVFDGMSDSAKAMAQSLAGSLGVANSTAASALSTVGDLLQAQGMGTAESLSTSASWIQQFQDIIAFKDINMSLEEFSQNFMSGAAGNLRNFRTFGSIVKESAVNARLAAQGYDKLTGSQLELAKMTARANIALEQQKNAMGATEREWDTMLSVNRRLNEAWKEYKENLGETLNIALKPMKAWLADILDYTNDVTRALKEIEGGEFTIKVQQESSERFINEVSDTLKSVASGTNTSSLWGRLMESVALSSGATMQQIYPIGSLSAKQLSEVMLSTGATGDQLKQAANILGVSGISDDLIREAEKLANVYIEQKKAIDAARIEMEKLGSETDTFTESLASLPHMLFASSDLEEAFKSAPLTYENIGVKQGLAGGLASSAISKAIANAIAGISGLTSDTFANPIDLAFGLNNKESDYTAWLNEIKDLYSILANRQRQFGDVTDETLQSVIDLWGKVNDELAKYQTGLALSSAYNSGLSSLSSSATGYNRQLAAVGLSELDAGLLELSYAFEDMKAQFAGFTDDELAELGIDLEKLDEEYNKQVKSYTDLYNAQQDYAALLEAQSSVSGFVTGAQGRLAKNAFVEGWTGHDVSFYNGSVTTLNKAQAGALYDYRQNWNNIKASLGTMTTNEAGQYDLGNGLLMTFDEIDHVMQDDLMQSFKDLADAVDETTSEFWKQYNPFQGTVDAFNTGKEELGGISGGIWGVLLELVKNTEAFQTLMSLVQDTIVPIMDAVLKPLMPALESITTLFDMLPWEIITFGIKVISSTLVLILHPIKMIFAIVHNIFEWLKHPVNKGARDIVSLNAIADETNALLDKIWKTTTDIERNTDKDNLALLRDLYSRGIINEDQFYAGARVVQKDMVFDPVQATNPSYIASNSPASRAISYGGFTFYITGNDPEETARATIRALREAGVDLPYNTAIGRA